MKRIIIFWCCLVLGIGSLAAEKLKEDKEGKKGRAAGGAHAQQGQPKGGKRGKLNRQSFGDAAELGGGGHGRKAGQRGVQRRFSTEGGNLPAVQKGKIGKAQVKHFDLAGSPNRKIESVKFRENNRIIGAEHWTGEKYTVFRSYHSVWHDRVWWTEHYPRIVLIGGGWYYWNAGFWYPAWGYDSAAVYYPYDGPIYAYNDLPPDQVIANVQEVLQNQGYYHGDVDGLLGPLTRAALADYQRDHGLYTTAAIDEPTMASLGFS